MLCIIIMLFETIMRLLFCYLKVSSESRIDTAGSYKDGQHATERKLCDDCVGTLWEGPNGVAIGAQLLFLLRRVLRQTTTNDVAELRLGHLRWKVTLMTQHANVHDSSSVI